MKPGPQPPGTPLDGLLRIVSGWSGVLVAICLLFPLVWTRACPRLAPEVLHVALTDVTADLGPALPEPLERAVRIEEGFATGMINRDGAFPLKRESIRSTFQVDRAGRYSIYGISSNDRAQPLELAFNGRSVSAMAFYENTGGAHGRLERHRIATGVPLVAGSNEVTLTGAKLESRTLILSVQRENPLGLPYAVLLFGVAAAACLAARRLVHVKTSSRARLAWTVASVLVILILLPAAAYNRWGRDLVSLGYKTPELNERLDLMDRYVDSRFRDGPDRGYRVAVFGDSTHYLLLEDDQQMIPALRRALPEELRDEVTFFGISIGGMAAWDYYLMLNRIAALEPDLVILPVNGSSFSEGWMRNEAYYLEELDRHLAAGEFPRVVGLSVGGRTFSWTRILHQRLDDLLFGGRVGPFMRGAKVYFEDEQRRISQRWDETVQAGLTPLPSTLLEGQDSDLSWGVEDVGPDHEQLQVFDLINALAARRGFDVLFYNVVEQALEQGGTGPVTSPRDMDTIIEILGSGPSSHVERFPPHLPPGMFHDRWIHLTPEGIDVVATRLAERVLLIRSGTDPADRPDLPKDPRGM